MLHITLRALALTLTLTLLPQALAAAHAAVLP